MTRYGFQQALSAFFLADIDAIRKCLPQGLTPIEVRPGHGILAITAFDFTESEVGAYGEFVVSVLLPPFAAKGAELPQSSFFPIILCTSTPASRTHATERWHLPQYDSCMDIRFSKEANTHKVEVWDGDLHVLDLSVECNQAAANNHLYQCFSVHEEQIFRVDLRIEGALDENENETGKLMLHEHPLAKHIASMITDDIPIREQSMGVGEQRFETLVRHGDVKQ